MPKEQRQSTKGRIQDESANLDSVPIIIDFYRNSIVLGRGGEYRIQLELETIPIMSTSLPTLT